MRVADDPDGRRHEREGSGAASQATPAQGRAHCERGKGRAAAVVGSELTHSAPRMLAQERPQVPWRDAHTAAKCERRARIGASRTLISSLLLRKRPSTQRNVRSLVFAGDCASPRVEAVRRSGRQRQQVARKGTRKHGNSCADSLARARARARSVPTILGSEHKRGAVDGVAQRSDVLSAHGRWAGEGRHQHDDNERNSAHVYTFSRMHFLVLLAPALVINAHEKERHKAAAGSQRCAREAHKARG